MENNKIWYRWWPHGLPYTLEYPQVSLFKIFEHRALEYPEKTFMIFYGNHLSYGQVLKESTSLIHELTSLGIKKGDRIAMYLQNSPMFVISLLAISGSGGVAVFLNPMLKKEEMLKIIEDSEPKIIITSDELLASLSHIRESGITIISGNAGDYISDEGSADAPEFLRKTYGKGDEIRWESAISHNDQMVHVDSLPEDPLLIAYTSGTTGVPKGCVHTNRSVIANAMASSYWRSCTPSTVEMSVAPFFHVTGLSFSVLSPIYSGATMVILSRWNKETFLNYLEKYRVTHAILISAMIADLLTVKDIEKRDFSSLRFVGGGGTAIPASLAEKFEKIIGLPFVEGYGMTEAMGQSHVNPQWRRKLQCIGIPQFGYDARIIDVESGNDVTGKETGEIVISGPSLFLGYYGKPEETEKSSVVINGVRYVRTGDIGYMDEEGYFFVLDRVKRMINRGGYKVWPAEVDSILYRHPAVKEACVVGTRDERVGEEVKAFIILKEESRGKITEEEIIQWSKEKLASYKYPRNIEFVDDFPRTASGKIDWRKLQEEENSKKAVK
ncbi:AMP-binding protein [Caldiplasma sukawensis]